jgi:hypothetical protein
MRSVCCSGDTATISAYDWLIEHRLGYKGCHYTIGQVDGCKAEDALDALLGTRKAKAGSWSSRGMLSTKGQEGTSVRCSSCFLLQQETAHYTRETTGITIEHECRVVCLSTSHGRCSLAASRLLAAGRCWEQLAATESCAASSQRAPPNHHLGLDHAYRYTTAVYTHAIPLLLTCDHLHCALHWPVACLQEPHAARPA